MTTLCKSSTSDICDTASPLYAGCSSSQGYQCCVTAKSKGNESRNLADLVLEITDENGKLELQNHRTLEVRLGVHLVQPLAQSMANFKVTEGRSVLSLVKF